MSKHEKLLFVQNVSKLKKEEQIYILRKLIDENLEMDESGKETLVNMKDINGKLFTDLNEYVCSCIKFNSNIPIQVKEQKELTDAQFEEELLEKNAKAHGLTLTQMKESKKKIKSMINKIKRAGKEPVKKTTKSKTKILEEKEEEEEVESETNEDEPVIEEKEDVEEDVFEEETIDNDKWLDE